MNFSMKNFNTWTLTILILTFIAFGVGNALGQQNLAQQANAIFEQHCGTCHGPKRVFAEILTIEHAALLASGTVVPQNPKGSEFYRRLLPDSPVHERMPLGRAPLTSEAIEIVRRWIEAGAPNWEVLPTRRDFITPDAMLTAIQRHVVSLAPFDRPFARYFTMTHLYNAGETDEALGAYRRALSKLINSLSWGYEVIKPQSIDAVKTLFYIDLRDYEWDLNDSWEQIEAVYPYAFDYDTEVYATLQQETGSEVPFIHVDWFLATASLPPLYHDILGLPETARELETRLEVNVVRNLQDAPGVRVWRAGFNESRVSQNNRVVERHRSRYGAYWKSYDFAGNVGNQNVFTHPLSFEHDGGEIIFNLPNGLQAYFLVTAAGTRLDEAPVNIVSNPAARDPVVRNGLSCIGCHTEGMKEFEDGVREVILQQVNPPYDKEQALRLYVEQADMEQLVAQDTQRFRTALEAAGGIFGGIEPVERLQQRFEEPLDAAHAAAAVGYTTSAFRQEIRSGTLQTFGLHPLLLDTGGVQRDTWTSQFPNVVAALFTEEPGVVPIETDRPTLPVSGGVHIPDLELSTAIHEALGKPPSEQLTREDMLRLTSLEARRRQISDLTGLEFATHLEELDLRHTNISDLTPLAGLTELTTLTLHWNNISDLTPLSGLTELTTLNLVRTNISNLTPLAGLTKLTKLRLGGESHISDLTPLRNLTHLEDLSVIDAKRITDLSPLAGLERLEELEISFDDDVVAPISDLSPLAGLARLEELEISFEEDVGASIDLSPLAGLVRLERLEVRRAGVTDLSPLAGLRNLGFLDLKDNNIADFSALEGLRANGMSVDLAGNPAFPKGGPKITGPWLWVIVPGERLDSSTDFLAQASGGAVTEQKVATNGATGGKAVGESKWRIHHLSATGPFNTIRDNINNMTESLGWGKDEEIYDHIIYGSVLLDALQEQQTTMFVGSDDAVKVWLNGTLVHKSFARRRAHDYQDFFPVTLRRGENVLLVALDNRGHGDFSGFFGFEKGTEYTVLPTGTTLAFSPDAPRVSVGQSFTLHLSTEEVSGLAGWQFNLAFDPAALSATQVSEGSLLKTDGGGTFFQKGTIDNQAGTITGLSGLRLTAGGVTGAGRLVSVTFRVKALGETRVRVQNLEFGNTIGAMIPVTSPTITINVGGRIAQTPAWDVNEDGVTDLADLALVAQAMGKAIQNPRTDVNDDGVVDGKDFALVAAHLGEEAAAAPSNVALPAGVTLETVEWALNILHAEDTGSPAFRRGIAKLEQLLALLVPDKTLLFANYPNPFNPETWMPYQLAKSADVTVSIYAADGKLVRELDFGHQQAGVYRIRSRAAYWDGRNARGEHAASGVYFYTFTAGDFTATRKMLLVK